MNTDDPEGPREIIQPHWKDRLGEEVDALGGPVLAGCLLIDPLIWVIFAVAFCVGAVVNLIL